MNQELKKRLARNWFKILQEVICKDIEETVVKILHLLMRKTI